MTDIDEQTESDVVMYLFHNSYDTDTILILEPFGDCYRIPAGETLEIRVIRPIGLLSIEIDNGVITFHSNAIGSETVYYDGDLIEAPYGMLIGR